MVKEDKKENDKFRRQAKKTLHAHNKRKTQVKEQDK